MSDAGWFPDPTDPDRLRYWDGAAWTEEVRPVPATSVLPPVLPFGVDPSTTQVPPPAPSSFGPPTAAWETTYVAPPTPRSMAPTYAARQKSGRRRPVWAIVLFVLLGLAVLGGAVFGVWKFKDSVGSDTEFDRPGAIESDGDGPVPEADVVAALQGFGIPCEGPGATGATRDEVVERVHLLEQDMAKGTNDQRDAMSDLVRAGESLPDGPSYQLRSCHKSLLIFGDSKVWFGIFQGEVPTAIAALDDLGLPLVSLAPPRITDTVRLLEESGETCPLPGRTTTKEVLLAELLPRLAPADGQMPDPKAFGEKTAIDQLPDQQIVVRNCTHTRLLGIGSWTQVVFATAETKVGFGALGEVYFVGP